MGAPTIWNSLVPRPHTIAPVPGRFPVPEEMRVWCEDERCRATATTVFAAATRFAGIAGARTNRLPRRWQLVSDLRSAHLAVRVDDRQEAHSYSLSVTSEQIEIRSGGTPGVAAGFATLVQALLLLSVDDDSETRHAGQPNGRKN